ncbi:FlgD immunoglobulin-like domain containing protein, partial [Streptomyces sp. NPDC089799]|uniref:FlgD immunoglobulin-like domain containing protein n=1 Tax=Streptomyces sp. NPDC089799 TaxID=3155066 RepID=UPI003442BE27
MLRRTTVAVAVVAAVTTALPLVVATTAAAVEVPPLSEYVIPARTKATGGWFPLVAATTDGFLRKGLDADTYLWTKYGENKPTPFPNQPAGRAMQADHATIAFVDTKDTGTTVVFRQTGNAPDTVITTPQGHEFRAVAGQAVLTVTKSGASEELHWLTRGEDGKLKDAVISALPSGTIRVDGSNTVGAQVLIGDKAYWVRYNGTVHPLPAAGKVKGNWLVREESWTEGDLNKVYRYTALDTQSMAAEKSVRNESETGGWEVIGATGNDLLLCKDGVLTAERLGGTEARVLLEGCAGSVGLADGRVLVIGGTSSDQAAYFVQSTEAGTPVVQRTSSTMAPVEFKRMAVENGRLVTSDGHPSPQPLLSRYTMPAAGAPQAGAWKGWGWPQSDDRLVPTGEGALVYGSGNSYLPANSNTHLTNASVKPVAGTVQASGRFQAYLLDTDPAHPVEVFDLDKRKSVGKITAPGGTFALSGYWLWREASKGVLEAVDVRTGSVVRTENVALCDIKELEAWGSSVLWKCQGDAGVYDTGTKTTVAQLPTNSTARLGNGFVAWEKDGVLKSTALRGDTGTRVIGKPVNAAVGVGWAVDKYSGRIAYADAGWAVHMVDAGVPGGNIAAIDRETPAAHDVAGGTKSWSGAWFLNKPASTWTLTVRAKAGGAVVRTINGTDARGVVRTGWDGKDAQGRLVGNGAYDWTLTGKPADGQGPDLKSTGTIQLTGGSAVRRDLAGKDGFGDLVTLDNSGNLAFHGGDGKGGLSGTKVTGAGWPTTSTVVPFGDVNG